ncbi:MAG: hypothetical protein HY248_05335 [Fimbriimonas ginsengisoli]|uniref:Motility protein n=1 Tax=Fimbriimonas ginsengisoli TaxID=1005039 RepID=A0A931LUR2_FIMGI|nr:hypothetical protein [Fimbriimonas ginsengisoli]MBI3721958.1 hypothetical protein [Fimbriimonas ginsengisoli]
MEISGAKATEAAMQPIATSDLARARLQAMLLQKSLRAQQQQGEELSRLAEGKGQVIDLRV